MRCCHTRIGPEPSHLIATAMAIIKGNVKSRSAQAITRSPKRISPSTNRSCRTARRDADRLVGRLSPRFTEPLRDEVWVTLAGKTLNGLAVCRRLESRGIVGSYPLASPRPNARATSLFKDAPSCRSSVAKPEPANECGPPHQIPGEAMHPGDLSHTKPSFCRVTMM